MIHLVRTDAQHFDFKKLVSKLDADLGARDGEEHAFYHQFNAIDTIKYAVVAFLDEKAVGCGAIKKFDHKTTEVKRMYVAPEARSKGIATKILRELETWTADLGYTHCILETGKRQPEAISLYQKSGYQLIPNYGQYKGVENSICFKKNIIFGSQPPTP